MSTGKTALITGITGQDGAYLSELLLSKGYTVHGIKRRSSSFNTSRIEHLYQDPHVKDPRFILHYGDMTDSTNLIRVVQETQPDEIYNLAAQSHVAVSFETPEYTANADAVGTLRLLEAVAKIAGVKLCQAYRRQHGCDFISVMPTNLYGPGDNSDLETSHVLPALIRKAHAAKLAGADALEIWGSGTPRREFLHVDDLADACVHLMHIYSQECHVNIGSGEDSSIFDLAHLVAEVVGFAGGISCDRTRPDGTPRKLLDSRRLRSTGWRPRIGLRDGIAQVYAHYQQQVQPCAS